jgi:surfactin synthase thioesterase subunit
MKSFICAAVAVLAVFCMSATAQHRVLLHGGDRLAIVGVDGAIEWEMEWGGIHDIHVFENGHIMVQEDFEKVVEIDPATKEVVWS